MRQPEVTDEVNPLHAGPADQPCAPPDLASRLIENKLAQVRSGDAFAQLRASADNRHAVGFEQLEPLVAFGVGQRQDVKQPAVLVENLVPAGRPFALRPLRQTCRVQPCLPGDISHSYPVAIGDRVDEQPGAIELCPVAAPVIVEQRVLVPEGLRIRELMKRVAADRGQVPPPVSLSQPARLNHVDAVPVKVLERGRPPGCSPLPLGIDVRQLRRNEFPQLLPAQTLRMFGKCLRADE